MNWKKDYAEKLCTPEEAVRLIKSGDRVLLGHCVAEPTTLVETMAKNHEQYKDVTVCTLVTLGKGLYTKPELNENFKAEGWFTSAATRDAMNDGHGDFVPVYFHEVPKYLRAGRLKVDVTMVMASPPDEHGYCSVGVSSDYTMEAVRTAKTVIVEVNDQMPRVYGDTMVHIKDMDAIIETSYPLPELQPPKIGEVEKAIGANCAKLIDDGATLQLGIGAIPDAVLAQLKNKKHLGIHSEMISDGVVDLFEAGAIDCSEKSINKGKMIVTFLMGTKKTV